MKHALLGGLSVLVDGEDGVPVVLLHGFPLDGRVWRDVGQELVGSAGGARARVLIPDLRGFGSSPGPAHRSIDDHARDVVAVLDAARIGRAVVVGLSMGGYVALALADEFPDRLAGLGLVDTRAGADSPEARSKRDEMIALAREKGADGVADAMLPRLLPAQAPEKVRAELVQILRACPVETIVSSQMAMRDRPDRTGVLGGVSVPVSVIFGELDVITPPEDGRQIAGACRDAEFVEIKGAGHMACMEKPDEVAAALSRLVTRVEAFRTTAGGNVA